MEAVAEASLRRSGYEVFCPMVSIRGRRLVMFSGYLFISDAADLGLSRAMWAWGVIRLLGGLNAIPVDEMVIQLILDRLTDDGAMPLNAAGHLVQEFSPGEFIQVIYGSLEGVRGYVDRVDGSRVSFNPEGALGATIHANIDEIAPAVL